MNLRYLDVKKFFFLNIDHIFLQKYSEKNLL